MGYEADLGLSYDGDKIIAVLAFRDERQRRANVEEIVDWPQSLINIRVDNSKNNL